MSRQSWEQGVAWAESDGAALSNTTTATSLLPTPARWLMPANYLDIGSMFRFKVAGRISNLVTTPGTLSLDVRLSGTKVFDGGAMQLSTTAHVNVPFIWEGLLTARVIGASAVLIGQAEFKSQAANISGADPTTGHSLLLTPNSAPAVGTAFDSTGSVQWDIFGTWSVANAANSITIHQFILEALN